MNMSMKANAMSARTLAAAPETARRIRVARVSPLIAPPNNFNASRIRLSRAGRASQTEQAITHGSLPKVAIERWTWSWEYVTTGWGRHRVAIRSIMPGNSKDSGGTDESGGDRG